MKTYLLNIENIPTAWLQGIEHDGKIYIGVEGLITFLDEHINLVDKESGEIVIQNYMTE